MVPARDLQAIAAEEKCAESDGRPLQSAHSDVLRCVAELPQAAERPPRFAPSMSSDSRISRPIVQQVRPPYPGSRFARRPSRFTCPAINRVTSVSEATLVVNDAIAPSIRSIPPPFSSAIWIHYRLVGLRSICLTCEIIFQNGDSEWQPNPPL